MQYYWRELRSRMIVCLLTSAIAFSGLADAEPLKLELYTEEFPPLQVQVEGKPAGYVVDFVKAIVEDAAASVPVQINKTHFVPWKRAIRATQMADNVLYFSILRTPSREDKYHWIGEISPYSMALYRHTNGPDVAPSNLEDIKQYRFGAQSGSAFEELLIKKGISNIMSVTYGRRSILLLEGKRIDFAPLVSSSYFYRMEQYGFDPARFKPVLEIEELSHSLWLVASKRMPEPVVEQLKLSYRKLYDQGLLSRLIESYQPHSELMLKYRKQKTASR
ncbi:substrate-binding periplasmic protein [Vibrio sp. SCSIO 43137]|uniref:substrate-binding periplasmic protein n=1 Tax=Vibrio sp. SCSIO 43137 TaxID=3021011 RepID=UPI002307140B|nr:ABC transporter substrate-binding protein [Vibrio sp. SCSIO 43137]WCE28315.1 ABC transporter substrate-binding protein [Vibrio sp. SCSIO 43137]